MGKRSKKKEQGTMVFRIDTMGLLTEIADAGLDRNMGILYHPLNIFKNLLAQVAQRATELNDPQLNVLMLSLGLYEVAPNDIPRVIEEQIKLYNLKTK